MNYRHAYHAGNHTEVFKHTALRLLVERFLAKPKPMMVLDTHAGAGLYDLGSPEASVTGEAAAGVGVVELAALREAEPYARAVTPYLGRGQYPGSSKIVADVMRPFDRLVTCELRRDDADRLRRLFSTDRRVSVHHRDGYEAMLAFVPPPERRGLVFVDPPYEKADEAATAGRRLVAAIRKWPTGTFAVWYPIKDGRIGSEIAAALTSAAFPNVLRAEFRRRPMDGLTLVGSGMIFMNPPWGYDDALRKASLELLSAMACPTGAYEADWLGQPT